MFRETGMQNEVNERSPSLRLLNACNCRSLQGTVDVLVLMCL